MATIITMPAVVADATEASLQNWLVAVGDTIATGQPIADIETEKATVELEAECAGTVGRLLVAPDTSVAVGDPIAVLVEEGEDESLVDRQIAVAGGPAADAADEKAPAGIETPVPHQDTHNDGNGRTAAPAPDGAQPGARVFSSPLARKLAKAFGVDVSTLSGSGPNGRILRRDVEAAGQQQAADATPAGGDAASSTSTLAHSTVPQSPTLPSVAADANVEDVPLSGMRKAIARRLTESKATVPHFYVSVDVEMDALLVLRRQVNEGLVASGQKATVNDFVLKALGGALLDVPAANASWQGTSIRRYSTVDVSVAVATDDGLLTPVVRNLDGLSISALCRTMIDYKERAGQDRIRQHELEGGAFSLTNLGIFGTKEFSAILNPPQAGILAVGAAEQRPVVHNGELAVATVMSCTLSADHRVVDGAVAAQLLAAFKQRIENPMSILL